MRRAIDPVDTIWLNMDRPNNLMVIESLMTCDRPIDTIAHPEQLLTAFRAETDALLHLAQAG